MLCSLGQGGACREQCHRAMDLGLNPLPRNDVGWPVCAAGSSPGMDQSSQRSQVKDRHALDATADQGVGKTDTAAAVHRAINVAGLDHLVVGAHDAARAAAAGAAGSATAAAEEVDLKPIGAAGRQGAGRQWRRQRNDGARLNRLNFVGHWLVG